MKCPKCGDEMSKHPIIPGDDGTKGYAFICESCELKHCIEG